MMNADVRKISYYTAGRIQALGDPVCSVHSVYERTANLLLRDGSLCALQRTGSPFSPLTLILSENDPLLAPGTLSPGDRVRLKLSADTRYADTAVPPVLSDGKAVRICREAGMRILSANRSGGFSPLVTAPEGTDFSKNESLSFKDVLVLSAAQKYLQEAKRLYRANDAAAYAKTAEALCGLIGMGGGLTPSGDDFLCGVLTALHSVGETAAPFRRCLTEEFLPHLDRTHPVSGAFLRCAADGQTSVPFIHFLKLAGGTSASEEGSAAQEIHAIGHSSGMDSLTGIVFALSVFV